MIGLGEIQVLVDEMWDGIDLKLNGQGYDAPIAPEQLTDAFDYYIAIENFV